ncbi:hypothetical protein Q787_01695 [Ornithobacterium rhinotracheale H06-030791]|nr:hypothetical protein Q787_01695 [Ornithobacterium rhinotracheale H06-030791]
MLKTKLYICNTLNIEIKNMKKSIIALSIVALAFSCKKENTTTTTSETTKTEVKKEVPAEAFTKNAQGEYVFAFNLEEGKTYPFSLTNNATMTQSNGQQSQTVKQTSTTALDYTVAQVKDSTYVLDVKFTRFKEENKSDKKTIGFDTDAEKPTDKGAARQWEFNKAIVGKVFKMEITRSGKVVDVTNLLPVRNAVKEELKKDLSKEEQEGLDQVLSQTLNITAIQTIFDESTSFYPKKAVKLGGKWSKSEGTDKAKSTMNYTLQSVDNGVVDIKIDGSSKGSDSQSNPQGVNLYRSLEGSVDGLAKLDQKSGWISSADIKRKEVVRETQEYQGQKMNFSSTTNTHTEINNK